MNIKIKYNTNSSKINTNNIVLVHEEKVPWYFWRIAIVTGDLPSRDSEIKEALVKIAKTNNPQTSHKLTLHS